MKEAEPQDKEDQESYLDQLLHSMVDTQADKRMDIPKKIKKEAGDSGGKEIMKQDKSIHKADPVIPDLDLEDLFSIDDIDIDNDLKDMELGDILGLEEEFTGFDAEMELDEAAPFYGNLDSNIDQDLQDVGNLDQEIAAAVDEQPQPIDEPTDEQPVEELQEAVDVEAGADDDEQPDLNGMVDNFLNELDHEGGQPEEDNNDDIMDLLNMLGTPEDTEASDNLSEGMEEVVPEEAVPEEEETNNFDDILSLLGEIDQQEEETPVMIPEIPEPVLKEENQDDDIFSLDEFLGDVPEPEAVSQSVDSINDIGDVIYDSLSAVSSEQEDIGMKEMEETLTRQFETVGKKDKKSLKDIFNRLFGNVHDEKAKKALEKETAQEKAKEAKKASKKKASDKTDGEPDGEEEGKEVSSKKSKKSKAEKKPKEKKEKKEKVKEIAEETEEEIKDVGRINKAGAFIVFIFFAAITILLVTGTDSFHYNLNIKNATGYFGIRKYTQAYEEVRGLTIKQKDQEIYNKIITVMYVNKQVNSYNNYFALKMYPEALDSLLKGFKRYDSYIADAEQLGIVRDFDYVREQIRNELQSVFGISEENAYEIINTASQELYSAKVREAAVVQ